MQHLQQPGLTTWACALAMLRESGVPAFFRGVGVPLLNSVLMNTVMFVVFEEVRSALPDTTGGALAAGAVSGLAQSLLSTPMDLLKIQVQLRGGHPPSILRRLAARSGAVGVASTRRAPRCAEEGRNPSVPASAAKAPLTASAGRV